MIKRLFTVILCLFLITSVYSGYHPASQVMPGTFSSGNFFFQGDVNSTGTICDSNGCIGSGTSGSGQGVPAGTVAAFYLDTCPPGWVAADGTGGTPDLRGQFIRGLNDFGTGSRSDGKQDPDGAGRTIGEWQNDTFMSHSHDLKTTTAGDYGSYYNPSATFEDSIWHDIRFGALPTGDNETRPKNIGLIFCVAEGDSTSVGDNLSSFSVHKNGTDQIIPTDTATKVTWTKEEFDTNDEFNITGSRFEPKVAGKYLLSGTVLVKAVPDGSYVYSALYKNGGVIRRGSMTGNGRIGFLTSDFSVVVDANPGDYFEVYVFHNIGLDGSLHGNELLTYFTGSRLDSDSYWSYNNSDISFQGGNVGIGTTNPERQLHIKRDLTNTAGMIRIEDEADGTYWDAGITNDVDGNDYEIWYYNGTSFNKQFHIGTNGNIGIGTTSPSAPDWASGQPTVLSIDGGDNQGVIDFRSGNSLSRYQIGGWKSINMWSIYDDNANEHRLAIDSSGNIGIGTTNPIYGKLQVETTGTGERALELINTNSALDSTSDIFRIRLTGDDDATGAYLVNFEDAGGRIGSITVASGSSVAYNTNSDYRLKENITDLDNALSIVDNLKPKKFQWRETGKESIGFIAQELNEVYPLAVTVGGEDVKTEPWAVDYSKLTPVLTKAIKELKAENDMLRKSFCSKFPDDEICVN